MNHNPPPPLDKATSYKGHPQPSVDERLGQAKIFLADEDLNRRLKFNEELKQIEEYLQYVEKEALACNPELFNDVKIMAKIQRDWIERMDAGPVDTSCCDPPALPNFSTRLVDAESARKLTEERERMGVKTQMREDHGPFTVKRSADQSEFLEQFKADSEVCPDIVDESENLPFVESEAYKWALNQPALIPQWMHCDKGLPDRGIRLGEQPPWWRQPRPAADAYTAPPISRPPMDELPEHLRDLEQLVNTKLKEDWYGIPGVYTQQQWRDIQDLMYILEPEDLQEQQTKLKNLESELIVLERLWIATPEDQQQVVDQRLDFRRLFCAWVEQFRDLGIQIKISKDGMSGEDLSGVFYVPTQVPQHTINALENSQQRLRGLLLDRSRNVAANQRLTDILLPYLPADIRTLGRVIVRLQQQNAVTEASQLEEEKASAYQEWIKYLEKENAVGGGVNLRLQLPGTKADESRDTLSCPWPSPFFPDKYGDPGQIPRAIKQLETDINDQLYEMADQPVVPDVTSNNPIDLGNKLRTIMYPRLREMAVQFVAWKPRVNVGHGDMNERNSYNAFRAGFEEAYQKWINSLVISGVKVRMPSEPLVEEDPSNLYFRQREPEFDVDLPLKVEPEETIGNTNRSTTTTRAIPLELDPENIDLDKWERDIAIHQRDHPLSPGWLNSPIAYPGHGALYKLLADLQYPRLKDLDLAWRKLEKKKISNAISEDEMVLQGELLGMWAKLFFRWQQGFGNSPRIQLMEHPEEENTRYATDDPAVVYYRGPFPDLSTFKPWETGSDVQPTDTLPDDIKQDQMTVRDILRRQLLDGDISLSQDDRNTLTTMFEKYWEAAQTYKALLNLKEETDEVATQRDIEQRRRRKLFIQQCVTFGFQIIPTPDGQGYMARDTTADTPDLWKVEGIDTPTIEVSPGTDYTAILNDMYVNQPGKFTLPISDIEEELNLLLRDFNSSKSTAANTARVIELVQPFLPRALTQLSEELKNDAATGERSADEMAALEKKQHDFEFRIIGFCRMLSDSAKLGGIRIIIDSSGVRRDSVGTGELLFPVPTLTSAAPKSESMDLDTAPFETLPTGLQRAEDALNGLLHRAYIMGAERDILDDLRRLWRIVMTPSETREDDRLRALDVQFRDGLLAGRSLESYEARQSNWDRNFLTKVIQPFGLTGIRIMTGKKEDAPDNHFVANMDNLLDLPPDFRSQELPPSVTAIQQSLNDYIRRGMIPQDPYYDRIFDFLWQPTSEREQWRQKITSAARQRHHLSEDDPLTEVISAEVSSMMNIRIRGALALVTNSVQNNSQHVRLIEIGRGSYDFVLEDDASPGTTLLDNDVVTQSSAVTQSEISNFIVNDITSGRSQPGLNEASEEYYRIAGKIKTETLSDSERAEAVRYLTPLSDEERKRAIDTISNIGLKHANNDLITVEEEGSVKTACLSLMWQNFGDSYPELRELVISTLDLANPHPIQTLLKTDLINQANDGIGATLDEIDAVATELNHLVAVSQLGGLSEEEDATLDFVLRPLATGHLAELYRQIRNLNERLRETSGLTLSEAISLAGLTKQYNKEWKEWKMSLPSGGIILDDLYIGPDVIGCVVQRYRIWQNAQRESDRNSANQRMPLDLSNIPASSPIQELFGILKEYVTKGNATGQDRLMLDRIPTSLQETLVELTGQRTNIENNGSPSLSESVVLKQLQRIVIKEWMEWFNGLSLNSNIPNVAQSQRAIDFTGKAERRGVQRAAIELALNLLATNQEQHRPRDKFRKVRLPPKKQPPRKEVPLAVPIDPWQRPIEVDPWKYTKIMRKYRHLKDLEYCRGKHATNFECPFNFVGPFTLGSDQEVFDVMQQQQNYLVLFQSNLLGAAARAPRPIIHTINKLIDEVCRRVVAVGGAKNLPAMNTVVDDRPLSQTDLNILRKLSDPSWYEGVLNYPDMIPGIPSVNPVTSKDRLILFEKDVNSVMMEIPFWTAPLNQVPNHPFDQPEYDPQIQSMTEDGSPAGWFVEPNPAADAEPEPHPTLLQYINTKRARHPDAPMGLTMWNVAEATVYLSAMSAAHKIYFGQSRGRALVARIPPNSHPETKYFISREEVERSPRATLNMATNAWEVQYDSKGTKGIAIIQPNKYEFLQTVARRLGRDIAEKTIDLTKTHDNVEKLGWRMASLGRAKSEMDHIDLDRTDISVMKMARDINKIAPDLAQEAGIDFSDPTTVSERDSGTIVQMQALEEANNCWEPRFPENENVWDWAAPRLNAKMTLGNGRVVNGVQVQYFNMRRWPLPCQSAETQTRLKRNTVVIQEEPEPEVLPPPMTRQEIVAAKKKKLQEEGRHTGRGQPPSFNFGETPVQQSYQSMIIESHLADVDAFYPKPDPPGFVSRALGSLKRKVWGDPDDYMDLDDQPSDDDPDDQFKLPKIPRGWRPDSVSAIEKRHAVAERLMQEPGFPNTEALYFSAAEVAGRQYIRDQNEMAKAKLMALQAIENYYGVEWKYIKEEQRRFARIALDIDPVTEMFRPKSKTMMPRPNLGMGGPAPRPRPSPARPDTLGTGGDGSDGRETGDSSGDSPGDSPGDMPGGGGTSVRGASGRGGRARRMTGRERRVGRKSSNVIRRSDTGTMEGITGSTMGGDMNPSSPSISRPTRAGSMTTGVNTAIVRYPNLPEDSPTSQGTMTSGGSSGLVPYPDFPPESPNPPARNTRSRSPKKRTAMAAGGGTAGSPKKKRSKRNPPPPAVEEEEEEFDIQFDEQGNRFTDV